MTHIRCRILEDVITTVTLISFDESVIWRQPHDLFRVAETGGGII